MKKYWLSFIFIAASVLAIKGQTLAYFLSDYLIDIHPIYHLTILTVLSIILFMIYSFSTLFKYVKNNTSKGNTLPLICVSIFFASLISFWSVFVLIMWWG